VMKPDSPLGLRHTWRLSSPSIPPLNKASTSAWLSAPPVPTGKCPEAPWDRVAGLLAWSWQLCAGEMNETVVPSATGTRQSASRHNRIGMPNVCSRIRPRQNRRRRLSPSTLSSSPKFCAAINLFRTKAKLKRDATSSSGAGRGWSGEEVGGGRVRGLFQVPNRGKNAPKQSPQSCATPKPQ